MFQQAPKSSGNNVIYKLKHELDTADAVIIGAGAGLSTSAGFTYTGERFHRYFSDFEEKYGFRDMYAGGFYPYKTPEEHWADYFVITTNVDHCFQKAGFDKKRLFYLQGDYGLFQCSEPCCKETFDNKEAIFQMVEKQQNMQIPSGLLPACPHCGKPMAMNLRSDDQFVEDEGWHRAAERYKLFLKRHEGLHILFLELGVGYNTPVIIKYPFWQMTAGNPKAAYCCINYGEAACPAEIQKQSICIEADIGETLHRLLANKSAAG